CPAYGVAKAPPTTQLLHGRTCGVSCDGGRARALQPGRRSSALQLTPPRRSITYRGDRDSAF
ncbi:hypothetical protein XcyCFBP4188_14775, partial [Xanthomonas hortorum pv. cynarae]